MQKQKASPIVKRQTSPVIRWIIRITIIIGLCIALFTSVTVGLFDPIYYSIKNAEWTKVIIRPSLLWVWKRPLGIRLIAVWDKTITNLRFPVAYASLILLVFLTCQDPTTILRMLFAMGLISFFNMLYYLHSEHSRDFVYGILYSYFSFFTLFWLFPYAAMTLRSRSWMTR